MPLRILLVEDDPSLAKTVTRHLKRRSVEVQHAETVASATELLGTHRYHAVILDVNLPDGSGLDLFRGPQLRDARSKIIVMTGEATVDVALGALRVGAVDFLLKPFSPEALDAALARVITGPPRDAVVPVDTNNASGWRARHAPAIVGEHPALLSVFDVLARVADTDCSILIHGETGSGKELIALAIHSASGRGLKPFVPVNCAAIPEQLMEAELFGHTRGAFTGAVAPRVGRFQAAHEGTLFLDEIGEVPLLVQAKLLRAVQEKEVTPIGESKGSKVDVRIVAATHRNLEEMVAQKQFREDLLYRLDVIRVSVPPLRQRASDVPLLVNAFVQAANERRRRNVEGVDERAMERLVAYAWPGNVRQLQNIVERMVLLRGEGMLTLDDVPESIRSAASATNAKTPSPGQAGGTLVLPENGLDLRETMDRIEGDLIDQALFRAGGNKSKAAQILRMNRTTLLEKLRKRGGAEEEPESS